MYPMKLSAQEEYGLRCLLQMARQNEGSSTTIPELSRAEGLSVPNVAKIMRLLRLAGFVSSVRGQLGGYVLARPAAEIMVGDVLSALGGTLYGPGFCKRHAGLQEQCVHDADCSLRALWSSLQKALSDVVGKLTLKDLVRNEADMGDHLSPPPLLSIAQTRVSTAGQSS